MKYTQQMIDDLVASGKLRETDFSYCDLSGLDLKGLNLSGLNLAGVNFENTDLSCARLRNANLRYANLKCANLSHADLFRANLEGANLKWANLEFAYLEYANLSDADLRWSILANANLFDVGLINCLGNGDKIVTLQIYPHNIVFTKDQLAIGSLIQESIDDLRDMSEASFRATVPWLDTADVDILVQWWDKWADHILKTHEMHYDRKKK